jgi:hypothetical protein
MATNIDKGLYKGPQLGGIGQADEEGIEIEIVDPEQVTIGADGLEIVLTPGKEGDEAFDANLADFIDEDELGRLAGDLLGEIDNDKNSRKDWEQSYIDGLKLMGLKYEERTEPWNGACGVTHPMITEAVVRFQSETIMETFPAKGPVLTKILGKETPIKKAAAARVQADMNYQLTERMVEYRSEHEKMLWNLPATGSAFKKVYYDPNLGRQTAMFVPAEDIVLPYGTSNIDSCPRVTHVMRKTKNDLLKLMNADFYRYVELGEPGRDETDIQKAKDQETGFTDTNDERYTLYEIMVDQDLIGYEDKDKDGDETGIALPYVITVLKDTNEVLSIRRNWREEDQLKIKRQHFVHYQYIPGFGSYGFGLFHLIGGYAKASTSILRQLVDSGTLSNLPGGLKSRGLRIKGDDTPIGPGEWRDVDVGSGAIRDNILPLPYKEPSQVLAGLMDKIIEEGRRFAATADVKISDMSAQAPVGTTLALLERQLKVMTAVQARVHFSLKQEFKLLKEIIADYANESYDYETDTDTNGPQARRSDFAMVEVIPVSDPNAATMSQRLVQYQAVIQLSQTAPQIYDLPQLHRGMLEVLGIKNAEKLVKLPEDQKPTDPVRENMDIITGKPVKAFLEQDHAAHIAVHMAALQDPKMAAIVGQNPMAQQIQAAAMAHINEHMAFEYRKQIEAQLGMVLPTDEEAENMDPEVAAKVAQMSAQAAQRLLQKNQTEAAQQQAQQMSQDPVIQMQQEELAIKKAKAQAEIEQGNRKLDIEEKRVNIDALNKADEMEYKQDKAGGDLLLANRKQVSSEELSERKLEVDAFRAGVMGRSADAAVLQADREQALRMVELIKQENATNKTGESGNPGQ